jgi:hypothetical protein
MQKVAQSDKEQLVSAQLIRFKLEYILNIVIEKIFEILRNYNSIKCRYYLDGIFINHYTATV